MTKRGRSDVRDTIHALFEAERTARRLYAELAEGSQSAVVNALAAEVQAARREKKKDEASLRLSVLAELLGEFEGDRVVDLLIDILDSDQPEARYAAGESLSSLAFDRFKEVAVGVERALTRLAPNSPALSELPFILVEVPEPGVVKLLERMLKQPGEDGVAAAIEASAELGDPGLVKALEGLKGDERLVQIGDDSGETEEVALGRLAAEAIELLQRA